MTIPLETPAVSRRHALITVTGEAASVRDLNSKNGTYVNDVRIQQVALCDGDRLRIGPVTLLFRRTGSRSTITDPGQHRAADES